MSASPPSSADYHGAAFRVTDIVPVFDAGPSETVQMRTVTFMATLAPLAPMDPRPEDRLLVTANVSDSHACITEVRRLSAQGTRHAGWPTLSDGPLPGYMYLRPGHYAYGELLGLLGRAALDVVRQIAAV